LERGRSPASAEPPNNQRARSPQTTRETQGEPTDLWTELSSRGSVRDPHRPLAPGVAETYREETDEAQASQAGARQDPVSLAESHHPLQHFLRLRCHPSGGA